MTNNAWHGIEFLQRLAHKTLESWFASGRFLYTGFYFCLNSTFLFLSLSDGLICYHCIVLQNDSAYVSSLFYSITILPCFYNMNLFHFLFQCSALKHVESWSACLMYPLMFTLFWSKNNLHSGAHIRGVGWNTPPPVVSESVQKIYWLGKGRSTENYA